MQGNRKRCFALCLAGALLLVGAVATPQRAGAAEAVSFAGKSVTMIISSEAGGGTDLTARLMAPVMARHLAGQPTVVYKFMTAAGGIAALNHLYTQAEPDGLTFLIGAGNQLNPIVLRRPEIKYDPTRLALIGGMVNPTSLLLARKEVVPLLKGHSEQPIHMGVLDGTRSGDLIALWAAKALDWNLSLVIGYGGTQGMRLALQRGEVDMMSNNDMALVQPVLDSGEAVVFAQNGNFSSGKLTRSVALPDVPLISDLVAGRLDEQARRAYRVWERQALIGKWLTLPPNTPAPIVEAYRAAYRAAAQDAEVRDGLSRLISPYIEVMTDADIADIIKDMVATTDESLQYIDGLTKRYRK
jgi:tripartite-type tricarboxylate transporter receptor subunit TctC